MNEIVIVMGGVVQDSTSGVSVVDLDNLTGGNGSLSELVPARDLVADDMPNWLSIIDGEIVFRYGSCPLCQRPTGTNSDCRQCGADRSR